MSKHNSFGLVAAIVLVTRASAALGEPITVPLATAQPMTEAPAQERPVPRGTGGSAHRLGLELTPVSPIMRIWALHATYSAWEYGDVIAGYVYQNEMIGEAGRANGHTLAVGYRQFFWRGFNLEIEHWIAYDPIDSSVDGRTYKGWDGWLEVMPGYRWDFYRSHAIDLFVLAQVEFGWPTFRTNPPPNMPEATGAPFVIPLVWLGARAF